MRDAVLDLEEVATKIREERAEAQPLQVSIVGKNYYPFFSMDGILLSDLYISMPLIGKMLY